MSAWVHRGLAADCCLEWLRGKKEGQAISLSPAHQVTCCGGEMEHLKCSVWSLPLRFGLFYL